MLSPMTLFMLFFSIMYFRVLELFYYSCRKGSSSRMEEVIWGRLIFWSWHEEVETCDVYVLSLMEIAELTEL